MVYRDPTCSSHQYYILLIKTRGLRRESNCIYNLMMYINIKCNVLFSSFKHLRLSCTDQAYFIKILMSTRKLQSQGQNKNFNFVDLQPNTKKLMAF